MPLLPLLLLHIPLAFLPSPLPSPGPARGVGDRRRQTQVQPDAEVGEEIAFASALASQLGYFDLASARLERLLRQGLPAEEERRVALASCGLLKLAAERELDRGRRLEFQSLAVRKLEAFLSRHGGSIATLPARLDCAEVAASRGRFLGEELQRSEEGDPPTAGIEAEVSEILREDPGAEPPEDPRAALVAAADASFAIAVREASRVVAAIEEVPEGERSEEQRVAFFRAWYVKGKAYHDRGAAAPLGSSRRADDLRTAAGVMNDYLLSSGEGSWFGLLGCLLLARTNGELAREAATSEGEERERRERLETALSLCGWVVENALPPDPEVLREVAVEEGEEGKAFRRERTEEAFAIALALSNREGDAEGAGRWRRRLLEWMERERDRSPSVQGYLALLEGARSLLVEGDATEALRLALRVLRENPRTTLELRAQAFLAEVAASGGGFDPEVLLAAAEGELRLRKPEDALALLRRALGEMGREADRAAHGGRACLLLGRAFEALGQPHEAAMAYRMGARDFAAEPSTAERNADGFHRAMLAIRRGGAGRNDEATRSLLAEAEQEVTRFSRGGSADTLLWRQAVRLREEALALQEEGNAEGARAKSAEALARLERIGPDSEWYERALARKGVIACGSADLAAARRHFDEFRRQVEDPRNDRTDPAGIARRKEAQAEADFFSATLALREAEAKGDPAARTRGFERAVPLLERALELHPERSEYHPRIHYGLVVAHLGAGNLEAAKEVLASMRERFAEDRFTGLAAARVFSALEERVVLAREAERRPGSSEEALTAALREAAEVLSLYNSTAKPSFRNWRKEADLWFELASRGAGEFDRPRALYEAILRTFADDPEAKGRGAALREAHARCLFAQGRLAKAEEELREILAERRTRETQLLLARCLGGHLRGTRPPFVEVAGTAEEEGEPGPPGVPPSAPKFEEANRLWLELLASHREAWRDAEFFDLLFGHLYMLHRWSRIDPAQGRRLRSSQEAFASQAPDLGESIAGPEAAARFRWLMDRTR